MNQPSDLWIFRILKLVVMVLAAIAGLGLLVMIATICLDVILRIRWINLPFAGGYDIVRVAGAVTLAAALPYTTAVKGHVAIEFFFHKFNHVSRMVIDSFMRLISIILFAFLGWRSLLYGTDLLKAGQVMQTLQLPIFWLPWFIGVCCFVVALVITYHLLYPNRKLIKL